MRTGDLFVFIGSDDMIRKKPRQVLTHIQGKRLRKIVATLGVLLVSWLLFAPDMGYLALKKKSDQIARLEAQKAAIQMQNERLHSQIDQWKTNPQYARKMAREKGYMKKEELLIEFN